MTTRLDQQADALLVVRCGLCGRYIHLAYPPMDGGRLDQDRYATAMLLHVRYGCPVR